MDCGKHIGQRYLDDLSKEERHNIDLRFAGIVPEIIWPAVWVLRRIRAAVRWLDSIATISRAVSGTAYTLRLPQFTYKGRLFTFRVPVMVNVSKRGRLWQLARESYSYPLV